MGNSNVFDLLRSMITTAVSGFYHAATCLRLIVAFFLEPALKKHITGITPASALSYFDHPPIAAYRFVFSPNFSAIINSLCISPQFLFR
jgi:hypothetical protein